MEIPLNLDILLKRPTPQDVIATILAYSDLDIFPSNRKKLHSFIKQEKEGEGKQILKEFIFSQGVDLFPFSRLLESVVMQLQLGGCLSAKNPEYVNLGITAEKREEIKQKAQERFSAEELIILQNIGRHFHETFGTS